MSLLDDLVKSTDFTAVDAYKKPDIHIPTPSLALNGFLGGGLPTGILVEAYGKPTSGKSTFMYEVAGNFQKQYPEGVVALIETEASIDHLRMRQLGLDVEKALVLPSATLETAFEQLTSLLGKIEELDKDTPVMVIWDSLAGCPSRAQYDTNNPYAGGMAERARLIKTGLTTVLPRISKLNVLVVLINQVSADIGGYRPSLGSSGGNALKHDIHLKLKFGSGKTEMDGAFAMTKYSSIEIDKSKISPLYKSFDLVIDISKGGKVDKIQSFLLTLSTTDMFKQSGGWYSINEKYSDKYPQFKNIELFSGKFRWKALVEELIANEYLVKLFELIWTDIVSEKYELQKLVCKDYRDSLEQQLHVDNEEEVHDAESIYEQDSDI